MLIDSSTSLLKADNLVKSYGDVRALRGISFEVKDGITGLLGPNGAGKSTAIRIFLGLLSADSGDALVQGKDSRVPEARSRLGYMPEHDCLPENLSASYILNHMAQLSGIPPSHSRSLAADTLRHVGLFEERYRPVSTYSTGMKQRVKLAQALVHDPVMVLLDEPTAGLDPTGREEMLDLIRKIHSEFGVSVVLSSHLMQDVERTCNRIIVLDQGEVKRSDDVSSLTESTEQLFIEVTDRRDEFMDVLRRKGFDPSVESGSVVVQNRGKVVLDAVRDALVESEAPLRSMGPRHRALLDIFRE